MTVKVKLVIFMQTETKNTHEVFSFDNPKTYWLEHSVMQNQKPLYNDCCNSYWWSPISLSRAKEAIKMIQHPYCWKVEFFLFSCLPVSTNNWYFLIIRNWWSLALSYLYPIFDSDSPIGILYPTFWCIHVHNFCTIGTIFIRIQT